MWAKAAKEFGEEGTDQIPTEYLVQCAFYSEIMMMNKVIIPVAFVRDNSGTEESIDRFAIYIYERNEQLGNGVIQKAVAFWENHVVPKIPPAGESLRKANPSVEAKITAKRDSQYIDEIKLLDYRIQELTSERKRRVELVQDYMEEYELLKDESGKPLATWKMEYRDILDQKTLKADHPDLYKKYVKRVASRVFRLKD